MKILAMGDGHITDRRPRARKDNYLKTVERKLKFIRKIAKEEKISAVLQPGDLFDSWKESDFIKQHMVLFFRRWGRSRICTVFGQHDLRYHSSDRLNTPTAILEAAGVITLLSSAPYIAGTKKDPVHIYGCSWGDEIPSPENKNVINILVMHSMVIETEKLWPRQEEFERGSTLLKKYPFQYIISGDNHQSFHIDEGDKLLINAGSMLRSRVDQADHEPCVWLIDTNTDEAEQIMIPIDKDVLNTEEHEKEKQENENLERFVTAIKGKKKIEGLDFLKNVEVKMSQEKVRSKVVSVINRHIEEAIHERYN